MFDIDEEAIIEVPVMGSDRIWFDPMLINAACHFEIHDVAMVNGVEVAMATARASRFGLGFAFAGFGVTLSIAPWTGVSSFPLFTSGTSQSIPFLTLFNYGPLLTNRWIGLGLSAFTVRVVELIRD